MTRHARQQVWRGPQEEQSGLDDIDSGLDDLESAASDFDTDALELVGDTRRIHLDDEELPHRFRTWD